MFRSTAIGGNTLGNANSSSSQKKLTPAEKKAERQRRKRLRQKERARRRAAGHQSHQNDGARPGRRGFNACGAY